MRPACFVCARQDFPECLHSPILRGLKVFAFVVTEPSRAGARPHQYVFVRRYASSPALVSQTKTSFAEFFSGLIERSAMKRLQLMLALSSLFVPQSVVRAQFANAVLSYDHGTGFAANFTNSNAALGAPTSGSSRDTLRAAVLNQSNCIGRRRWIAHLATQHAHREQPGKPVWNRFAYLRKLLLRGYEWEWLKRQNVRGHLYQFGIHASGSEC